MDKQYSSYNQSYLQKYKSIKHHRNKRRQSRKRLSSTYAFAPNMEQIMQDYYSIKTQRKSKQEISAKQQIKKKKSQVQGEVIKKSKLRKGMFIFIFFYFGYAILQGLDEDYSEIMQQKVQEGISQYLTEREWNQDAIKSIEDTLDQYIEAKSADLSFKKQSQQLIKYLTQLLWANRREILDQIAHKLHSSYLKGAADLDYQSDKYIIELDNFKLVPYGSHEIGSAIGKSDLDLSLEGVIEIKSILNDMKPKRVPINRLHSDYKPILLQIVGRIIRYDQIVQRNSVRVIPQARIPVIKFQDSIHGIHTDICIANTGAVVKSQVFGLIIRYANILASYAGSRLLKKSNVQNCLKQQNQQSCGHSSFKQMIQPPVRLTHMPSFYLLFFRCKHHHSRPYLPQKPISVSFKLRRGKQLTVKILRNFTMMRQSRLSTWTGSIYQKSWRNNYLFHIEDPFEHDANPSRSVGIRTNEYSLVSMKQIFDTFNFCQKVFKKVKDENDIKEILFMFRLPSPKIENCLINYHYGRLENGTQFDARLMAQLRQNRGSVYKESDRQKFFKKQDEFVRQYSGYDLFEDDYDDLSGLIDGPMPPTGVDYGASNLEISEQIDREFQKKQNQKLNMSQLSNNNQDKNQSRTISPQQYQKWQQKQQQEKIQSQIVNQQQSQNNKQGLNQSQAQYIDPHKHQNQQQQKRLYQQQNLQQNNQQAVDDFGDSQTDGENSGQEAWEQLYAQELKDSNNQQLFKQYDWQDQSLDDDEGEVAEDVWNIIKNQQQQKYGKALKQNGKSYKNGQAQDADADPNVIDKYSNNMPYLSNGTQQDSIIQNDYVNKNDQIQNRSKQKLRPRKGGWKSKDTLDEDAKFHDAPQSILQQQMHNTKQDRKRH